MAHNKKKKLFLYSCEYLNIFYTIKLLFDTIFLFLRNLIIINKYET